MTQFIVLVADDSGLFRASMHEILDLVFPNIRVLEARNGLEVIDLSRGVLPNLILLDLYLPPYSGHEVAAVLRRSPKTQDILIVLMSNAAIDLAPADLALYQAVLPKPFPMKSLFSCIKELYTSSQPQN